MTRWESVCDGVCVCVCAYWCECVCVFVWERERESVGMSFFAMNHIGIFFLSSMKLFCLSSLKLLIYFSDCLILPRSRFVPFKSFSSFDTFVFTFPSSLLSLFISRYYPLSVFLLFWSIQSLYDLTMLNVFFYWKRICSVCLSVFFIFLSFSWLNIVLLLSFFRSLSADLIVFSYFLFMFMFLSNHSCAE